MASVDEINCFFPEKFGRGCSREVPRGSEKTTQYSLYQYFRTIKLCGDVNRVGRRLPFTGHASTTAIFSYLSGGERLAAQFDRRGPSTTDILKPLSVIGLVDVEAVHRCTHGPFQCIGRIVGQELPLNLDRR